MRETVKQMSAGNVRQNLGSDGQNPIAQPLADFDAEPLLLTEKLAVAAAAR